MDKVILPYSELKTLVNASESLDLKLDVNNARNFWGFALGTARNGEVLISEVQLNQPDWVSEDFSLQQAILEDGLFSSNGKISIAGGIRSHHKQGLIPSPEDLQNLANLQAVNPNAVFVVFDLASLKTYAEFGAKAFRLVEATNPDGGIRDVPIEIAGMDEDDFTGVLTSLYGAGRPEQSQVSWAGDEWMLKAKDAEELENYADAEIFYKKALQVAQQANDVPQQLDVELKMLRLMIRDLKYGRVLRQSEKVRAKALEKNQMGTVAKCLLIEGEAQALLGNPRDAITTLEKVVFQFQNLSEHVAVAHVQILIALLHVGMGNRMAALEYLLKAVGNFRNILDEEVRQEYLRRYSLEQNTTNLIKSFPEKELQQKYIKILNDVSEFRGYKVTLEEF
jgi:tetratricopeptide (TPR) repeat protein